MTSTAPRILPFLALLVLATVVPDPTALEAQQTAASPDRAAQLERHLKRVLDLNPARFYLEHEEALALTTDQRRRISDLEADAQRAAEAIIDEASAKQRASPQVSLRVHRDAMRALAMWRREYTLAAREHLDERQRELARDLRRRRKS